MGQVKLDDPVCKNNFQIKLMNMFATLIQSQDTDTEANQIASAICESEKSVCLIMCHKTQNGIQDNSLKWIDQHEYFCLIVMIQTDHQLISTSWYATESVPTLVEVKIVIKLLKNDKTTGIYGVMAIWWWYFDTKSALTATAWHSEKIPTVWKHAINVTIRGKDHEENEKIYKRTN